MKVVQETVNEILESIENGNLSIFGVDAVRRNRVQLYKIVRCDFKQELKREIKVKFKTNIENWFSLDVSEYSPTASVSDTLISCDTSNYGLEERVDFIKNTQNQESWDKQKFYKSKFFMYEFSYNQKKLIILSKCPSGWNLASKPILNILDNDKFAKSKKRSLLFNDRPEMLHFDTTVYTKFKFNFENFFKIEDGLRFQLDSFSEEVDVKNHMDELELFKTKIRGNKRYLNLLSDAFIKGVYKTDRFWEKVKRANDENGWGLTYSGDQIRVTEEKIEDILYILKDGKVKSMITGNKYNMDSGLDQSR